MRLTAIRIVRALSRSSLATLAATQHFTPRRDGTTLLTMTVRDTTELVPWILSLGPYVEVLKPRALREEVQESLAEAARIYVAAVAPTRSVSLAAS